MSAADGYIDVSDLTARDLATESVWLSRLILILGLIAMVAVVVTAVAWSGAPVEARHSRVSFHRAPPQAGPAVKVSLARDRPDLTFPRAP
jgi:hypothetical protein